MVPPKEPIVWEVTCVFCPLTISIVLGVPSGVSGSLVGEVIGMSVGLGVGVDVAPGGLGLKFKIPEKTSTEETSSTAMRAIATNMIIFRDFLGRGGGGGGGGKSMLNFIFCNILNLVI
jgi:hypothetical protein